MNAPRQQNVFLATARRVERRTRARPEKRERFAALRTMAVDLKHLDLHTVCPRIRQFGCDLILLPFINEGLADRCARNIE